MMVGGLSYSGQFRLYLNTNQVVKQLTHYIDLYDINSK